MPRRHRLGDIYQEPNSPHQRWRFTGYSHRRTVLACVACHRVTKPTHEWDIEYYRRCIICGHEAWEVEPRSWGTMYLVGLNWDFCPEHVALAHEFRETIRLTVRAEAQDFLRAVVERVARQQGKTIDQIDYGKPLKDID